MSRASPAQTLPIRRIMRPLQIKLAPIPLVQRCKLFLRAEGSVNRERPRVSSESKGATTRWPRLLLFEERRRQATSIRRSLRHGRPVANS